jgi:chaperonin GroES
MSKVPLTPLADYVVAQQEAAQTKTASGLFLPDKGTEKPKIAAVVAVGPLVKEVASGDKIIFGGYSNTEIKINGVEYMLIKLENIFAKIN